MPGFAAIAGQGVFVPLPDALPLLLPWDEIRISAGFPSPAADYEDKCLDINEYLVRNPVSTFFFSVEGDSMQGAEIFAGDIIVVDKSIRPQHAQIVVAFVDGQRLVKRLYRRNRRVALLAENPLYHYGQSHIIALPSLSNATFRT